MIDKITEELRILQETAENPSGQWDVIYRHRAHPSPTGEKVDADWSGLPKDLYVTSAKRIDAVVWEATLCSVPMAIGPEVRYSAASTIAALVAERDALRAAIFGGANYDSCLRNGNFVEMARATESARQYAVQNMKDAESALATANARVERYRAGFARLLALYESEFVPEDIVRPRWVLDLLNAALEPPHEAPAPPHD